MAIEVKAVNGKLTPEQDRFLTQVTAAGHIAIVARSVLDVYNKLKELGHVA